MVLCDCQGYSDIGHEESRQCGVYVQRHSDSIRLQLLPDLKKLLTRLPSVLQIPFNFFHEFLQRKRRQLHKHLPVRKFQSGAGKVITKARCKAVVAVGAGVVVARGGQVNQPREISGEPGEGPLEQIGMNLFQCEIVAFHGISSLRLQRRLAIEQLAASRATQRLDRKFSELLGRYLQGSRGQRLGRRSPLIRKAKAKTHTAKAV